MEEEEEEVVEEEEEEEEGFILVCPPSIREIFLHLPSSLGARSKRGTH